MTGDIEENSNDRKNQLNQDVLKSPVIRCVEKNLNDSICNKKTFLFCLIIIFQKSVEKCYYSRIMLFTWKK